MSYQVTANGIIDQSRNLNSVNTATGNVANFNLFTGNGIATTSQIRANTANKIVDTSGAWQSIDYVTLTDQANVVVDMSLGINFSLDIANNRTLNNPTNVKNGQSGIIKITQDGTGSRTLVYQANWKFPSGTAVVLSTTAASIDLLSYVVVNSTFIALGVMKDVK